MVVAGGEETSNMSLKGEKNNHCTVVMERVICLE